MATTETRETILRVLVDNNKALAQIAEWNQLIDEQKAKQQELAKARKEGSISESDYQKAMAVSRNEVTAYSKQMQQLNKEVQNNVTSTNTNKDSLAALRAELSNATKEFDNLSAAERNGAKGQELAHHINVITDELKAAEESTQRYYRNVGNYKNGIVDAFASMGGAAGGMVNPIKNATLGLKTMSKTPVIAILGILVNIIAKVIEKLKSSEDNTNRVSSAFSAFGAVGTMVTRLFQGLGKVVAKVAEYLGKAADKLGLVTDAMKTEQQLTRDQIALTKIERENRKKNADDELAIAQLKAKAAEKLTYSAQERIGFLQEAADREKAISQRNLDAAREEYRILEEKSKLADNSAEENDALAAAYEKMRQAETAYFNKSKELAAQMVEAKNQLLSQTNAQASADKKASDQAEKDAQAAVKAEQERVKAQASIKAQEIAERLKQVEAGSLAELDLKKEQLQQAYDMEVARLEQQEGTAELIKLKKQTLNQELQALDDAYYDNQFNQVQAETDKMIDEWQKQADAEKEILEARRQMQKTTATAISAALGDISSAIGDLGEENSALTKLSKVLAIAQIAIDTGVATAEGIKNAMAVPFPANIAAIATTIAAVVSGMASAIVSVKSAKFASGGLVTGPGTATSDSIPARLSNGESVINARSTSMFAPILSALNEAGGGKAFNGAGGSAGFDYMASAVAAGMASADIYVSVEEIDRVGTRMSRIKGIATR